MPKGLTFNIELRGWRELDRKLSRATDEGGVLAEPWQAALEEIGVLGEAGITTTAPIETGATINKAAHKVQKRAMPRYVVVKTSARRGRYSYPRFTNYSPVASRLRPVTKSGALRRAQPNRNKGWFDRGIQRVITAMPGIMERAARQIEQRWAFWD